MAEGINSKQWQPWLELYLNNLSLSQIAQSEFESSLRIVLFLTMANLMPSFPFQTK
jgi:hypothetical protein